MPLKLTRIIVAKDLVNIYPFLRTYFKELKIINFAKKKKLF
jgi:hypothetical protein